jgi:hypothetical protein
MSKFAESNGLGWLTLFGLSTSKEISLNDLILKQAYAIREGVFYGYDGRVESAN